MTVRVNTAGEAAASAQLDASQVPNVNDLEMALVSVEGDVSFLKADIDDLREGVSGKASADALAMLEARLDGITERLTLLEARL